MESWIVKTKNLKKYYRLGTHTVKALDDVNFAVREQEFVAIIGKSGSGKSTLLHMIGGLDTPTSGEVYVGDKALGSLAKNSLPSSAEGRWASYSRVIIWCRILMYMKM